MKVLTLFLALFLSFLPESLPVENDAQPQDVFCEDVEDFEEEAVIRSVRRDQSQPLESFLPFIQGDACCLSGKLLHPLAVFCLERQWLTLCRLRNVSRTI